MKNYSDKYYQKQIASEYDIGNVKLYTNRLASISNRAITGFKSNCILSGLDCYIVDKTKTDLRFYITPGKFLANDILNEFSSPIILDTENNITPNTRYIFIAAFNIDNQYKFKLALFLVEDNRIYNPQNETWNDSFLILNAVRLVFDNDYYRLYGYTFHPNYKEFISQLNIGYPIQYNNLNSIGYASDCDYNSELLVFNKKYTIRPTLSPNKQILDNLKIYVKNTGIHKDSLSKVPIPDLDTYLLEYERQSRINSIFGDFYNDFYS